MQINSDHIYKHMVSLQNLFDNMKQFFENGERYGRLKLIGFKLNMPLLDLSLDPLKDNMCPFAYLCSL